MRSWVLKWSQDSEYLQHPGKIEPKKDEDIPVWLPGQKNAKRFRSSKEAWSVRAQWPTNARKYIKVMRVGK